MNQSPFSESSASVPKPKKSFLGEHCEDFNLSALAIVFGVGLVLGGLILTVIALVIAAFWPSPIVGYATATAVLGYGLWLWVSLVLIGRKGRHLRTSDTELIALQVMFMALVFGEWLFASPQDRATFHTIGLLFEWCVIAFHILYFLLALCVWVKLPLRPYLLFMGMVALAIFGSMR